MGKHKNTPDKAKKINKKERISLSTWSFSDLMGEAWRESRYSSSTGPTAREGFLSLWASSSFSWLFPLLYTHSLLSEWSPIQKVFNCDYRLSLAATFSSSSFRVFGQSGKIVRARVQAGMLRNSVFWTWFAVHEFTIALMART